jgi:hypothetical protein
MGGRSLEITIGDRTQSLKDWAAEAGLPYGTVHQRVRVLGWPVERALSEPPKPRPENVLIEHSGRAMTANAWAKVTGVPSATIRNRLALGWSVARALETPR